MVGSNLPPGLTFDDILILPGFSDFSRNDIDLSTHLTNKIKIQIPLVSAPMDTVTEADLAIALGKLGGVGIIHRNLSIENQVKQVKKVKKQEVLVGAAVGTNEGFLKRVFALEESGVDVIVMDSAHGNTKSMIDAIGLVKSKFPNLQIIAGNIATSDGAKNLIEAGADGLRVGMGPGAICTTRIISGMGVPQVMAIVETRKIAKRFEIPIIADGGIKYSGDIVKALALGASAVMMGSFFASTVESPGRLISPPPNQIPSRFKKLSEKKKLLFKEYRGMGSIGAMKQGAKIKSEDEFHGKSYNDRVLIAEGVEGLVLVKGYVKEMVEQSVGGIKSGLYYMGSRNIPKLWSSADFIQITQASLTESHPHDIFVTNPGNNY